MAAVDYFLKIDGIQGESRDAKHKGEIELESFSWAERQSQPRAAARGGGKVEMLEVNVSMRVNKASPKLLLACATGQQIKQATFAGRRNGGKSQHELLVYKFIDVLVTS